MTTYSKRRGRRSLAAILAAMLMASVLAVVAGSPAQAANTSFEAKTDHDNNAATATVREFAGQDRYDTALRLATNFASSKGGLGAVPVAFVASGETLVDSISVAGLAGYVDAPILLTPSGSLHGGVADFLEDYDVKTVHVLGGTAAVSDAVVTAIEGLDSDPTVNRVSGDDRYATAAAIAGMIDSDSSWCGTDAVSAVLINGSTDILAYGVAVQTTAYRLQLPVLMTAAGELPDATAEFITENDVEHVQIIGGTDTVSAGVASALTTLGVDTVARVEGDSAATVSVMLAKSASNGCGDDLAPVSTDRVVLVRGNPDGVAAAPVLASSLANGALVTPLIVGDSLPASVRDYLAATPKTIGTTRLNLGIVAVGGTAAVSQATMDAALAAAASAGTLSVSIGASTDTDMDMKPPNPSDPVQPGMTFSLYFSDDVVSATADDTAANAELLGKVRDIIEVNGAKARVTSATTETTPGVCTPRRVDVTLTDALTPGDRVSVVTSTHTFGTQSDQRRIAASASATVQAVPRDTTRPRVTIIGIANESAFQIRIADVRGLAADAEIDPEELTFTSGRGEATLGTVTHAAGETTATVAVTRAADAGGNATANTLVAGDRLTIKSGALADTSENVNAATTGRAIAEQASPKITSVLMSNPRYSVQTRWEVPDTFFPDDTPGTNEITIVAKADGDAAGAAGNGWKIVFDTPTSYDAEKAADIDVRVAAKSKTATVTFRNGPVTIASLLAALKADSEFDALFGASTGCDAVATTRLAPSPAAADRDALSTFVDADGTDASAGIGRTQFAVEVGFNAYIATAVADELLDDILARTLARNRNNADADTLAELRPLLGIDSVTDADTIVGGAPGRTVRYEMETASVALMPMARDRVLTLAGAEVLLDNPNTDATETDFRSAEDHVATGYAEDVDTTTAKARVDQNKNTRSDVRITVSSGVKAR